MTNAFSGTHRILTIIMLCTTLVIGAVAFSSPLAHAAPHASKSPAGGAGYCYLELNGSNYDACVQKVGYNGISSSVFNVTSFYTRGNSCQGLYGWFLEYTGNSKAKVYFNIAGDVSGPLPPYGVVTQVDVETVTNC